MLVVLNNSNNTHIRIAIEACLTALAFEQPTFLVLTKDIEKLSLEEIRSINDGFLSLNRMGLKEIFTTKNSNWQSTSTLNFTEITANQFKQLLHKHKCVINL